MNKVNVILSLIPKTHVGEIIKTAEDAFLDAIENFVARTDNDIDDAVILPAIKGIRKYLNIPDCDEGENNEA